MEGLEVFTMFYESEESWAVIRELIMTRIAVTYLVIQFALGSVLSLIILGISEMSSFKDQTKTALRLIAALLILVGVFAMRWNVVVGGQLISKSLRGLTEYTPPLLGESGILVSAALMAMPFIILALIAHFVPPWDKDKTQEAKNLVPQRASFR